MHQGWSRGPSKPLLAGLQGHRHRTVPPLRPCRSRYPPGHDAKSRPGVSSRQALTVSGRWPLGHFVSDFSAPQSLGGEQGPRRPLSSFDASGAPSRPHSPLAEGPNPHGHPHVRHPSSTAQAQQVRPAAASPAQAPNPAGAQGGPARPTRLPGRARPSARRRPAGAGPEEPRPILSPVGGREQAPPRLLRTSFCSVQAHCPMSSQVKARSFG